MRDRESMLRTLLVAGAIFAFTAPASAAGMGGVSVGGIGIGVPAAGGGLAGVSGAIGGAVGGVTGAPGTSALGGGHLPVGAGDGPSGLSASSGHNPFGSAKPSSAWSSLPALDPNLPGVTVPAAPALPSGAPSLPSVASLPSGVPPLPSAPSLPSAPALPGLGKGGPSAPSLEISAKADLAGHSESANVNTASLPNSLPSAPGLPSTSAISGGKAAKSSSLKAPGAPDLAKTAKLPSTTGLTRATKIPTLSGSSPIPSKQAKALSKEGIPTSPEQEEGNLSGALSIASSTASSEVTSLEQTAGSRGAPTIPSSKSINQTVGQKELAASVLGGLAAHETQGYINQQVGPITGGNPGSAVPSDPVNLGPHNAD